MTKLTVLSGLVVALLAAAIAAQEARFEVASVKPNVSADIGGSFGARPGGQLIVRNNTLRNIIRNAYNVQNFQIVGGPDWLDRDRFDITASAGGDVTQDQLRVMVQALLAERFKLVIRRETRDVPVYALVLARDGTRGPALRPSSTDCAAIGEAARRGVPVPPPAADGRPLCGTRTTPGRMAAGGVRMSDLARNLSNFAGRTTVDKTGLAGAFDLTLEWLPDQLPPPGTLPAGLPPPPSDGPSLFTALQEQLGLKLESDRGPVEVLVIDSAERPTPD